ncbi:MAG: dTMP kinase [Patescibacteria group bacterium]
MKKGKLIVIDGIDGSGKSTQIKLLLSHLRRAGRKTYLTDFPQYEKSFFGRMVRRYLKGDFGQTKQTDPHLISLLYALDRFEAKEKMWRALKEGKIIVSDRYSPANKIHQAIKIKGKVKKEKFYAWLDELEFRVLGIPRPDLTLFLDVPPNVTRKLMIARGKRDIHEVDFNHQKLAYKQCQVLVKKYKNWQMIPCLEKGKFLAPQIIHQKVWQAIKKLL